MRQHLLQGDGHQLPRFVAGATSFDTADRQARISQTILSPFLGMHSIGLGAEKYAVAALQHQTSLVWLRLSVSRGSS